MRKIAIVTGTRAEFGLLTRLISLVHEAENTELQLVVTAAHLSPEFGMTVNEIEAAGFPIAERVEMLLSSDTATGVTKATGLGMIGFADAFARLRPDVVVLLGDRFELLGAAAAALFGAIPIAHLHGGETTEGAFDEAVRHAITKMAHLHFTAAAPYSQRVCQLGEDPANVFTVGGMGQDAIASLDPVPLAELQQRLGLSFAGETLMLTYHPETVEGMDPAAAMSELFASLDQRPEAELLFTLPNADVGGRGLIAMIERYVARRKNAVAFPSLGQRTFLSALQHVSAVVGNSSSGLLEAPSFGIPTVDIGDRQAGRLRATSVVHCAAERGAIADALDTALSSEFRASAAKTVNPYGSGGASQAVFDVLRSHPLDGLLRKRFHDIAPADGECV